jgi:hypothetical protein
VSQRGKKARRGDRTHSNLQYYSAIDFLSKGICIVPFKPLEIFGNFFSVQRLMNEEKVNQKCILIEVKERFVSFKLVNILLE